VSQRCGNGLKMSKKNCDIHPFGQETHEWTNEKNQRRCALVDKEIEGTLSAKEEIELEKLQAEMLAYRRKVAPLPIEKARKMH